jgi:hypothetical protein
MPVVDEQDRVVGVIQYDVLRALEGDVSRAADTPNALELAVSVGELYLKGVAGMLGGLLTAGRLPGNERPPHGSGEGI